jgi:hypothetical protein
MLGTATPLLWHWPTWTYAISWLWTNPVSYNFWSSGWGESLLEVVKFGVLLLLLRPLYRRVHIHLQCDFDGCTNWGHPVHATGYRACHSAGHHPAVEHKPGEPITAEHIARAHAKANNIHS